jgi:hypothetical protein
MSRKIYTLPGLFANPEKLTLSETLDGIYFQHSALFGRLVITSVMFIVSFIIAIVLSEKKDAGTGFTVGAYLLVAIPVLVLLIPLRLA